jgi:ABC-2 type transport system ATP-binding protein
LQPDHRIPQQIEAFSAISVRDLVRDYETTGSVRNALRGITFDVSYGEVVGLLGPNGAGKTSCVRILSTLLLPTSGRAFIDSIDVVRHPKRVQRLCGISFGGDTGLYGRLSARDNLRFFGTMYGMHGRLLSERAAQVLATVGLHDRAKDRVETFSRGMRQRLHLARSLLHDPPVLLLDEPSSGLDLESARALRHVVKTLREQGRAILLTTHNLSEAERICDRILVLVNGSIIRSATPQEMREQAARSQGIIVEFRTDDSLSDAFFADWPGLIQWTVQSGSYRVRCHDAPTGAAYAMEYLRGRINTLQIMTPTFEDAYLEVLS